MAVQPHFLGSMTLKALLEDPNLKNPPLHPQSSSHLKVKKEDGSSELPQFNYGSAFLGPNLWDKTYDGMDFNLEYMDLEEFLSENGIADAEEAKNAQPKIEESNPAQASIQISCPPQDYHQKTPPMSPSQFLLSPPAKSPQQYVAGSSSPNTNRNSKSPSPPVSPFNVEFQMSEQDLALSSIPDYGDEYRPKWQQQANGSDVNRILNGQEDFDPRRRNFSEEELKPQPILKKSKKVFVPDDLKDEKYWARRHKNNYAAKRSRDARRVKENQIAMRAAFLEKENSALRDEVQKLRKENVKLKLKVSKYEPTTEIDTPTSSSGSPLP